jgi:proteasome accessory factor A
VRLLNRIAGLETEYPIRFRADAALSADLPDPPRPSNVRLFEAVMNELRRLTRVARADHSKRGYFLGNGGAVWLEKGGQGLNSGMVEGATPECRGPRRLLAQQRAQDAVLAAAARDASAGGEFVLCKSDCDAWGQAYGAQENYEVPLADGWRWTAWRVGLVLLVVVAFLTWFPLFALCLVVLALAAVAAALYFVVCAVTLLLGRVGIYVPVRTVRPLFLGRDAFHFANMDARADVFPDWMEWTANRLLEVCFLPLGTGLLILAHLTAFRDVRRQLLPFLVSRAVFSGTGRVTRDGGFHIAAKAGRLTRVTGINGFRLGLGEQCVFGFGHVLRSLVYLTLLTGGRGGPLAARRQRLQICLGDSNLCEDAEYLRVGTTMLVLDAIEAGALPPAVPRLRRPLRALRRIIADPTLQIRVPLAGGRGAGSWTALAIQRFYLRACEDFVARVDAATPEHDMATDILRRWADVLDRLESAPHELVGRVDWVTKRFLLNQCGGPGAPWEVRKKIDLRYHELSPDGYFERLRAAGVVRTVLSEAEVERAKLEPPPDTRAAARARHLRELADDLSLRVGWDAIKVGPPGTSHVRTIELSHA